MQSTYGKTASAIFSDFEGYLKRNRFYEAVFNVKLSKSEEDAEVTPASGIESDLVLAGLLAATRKSAEADEMLQRMRSAHPENPEIPEALGYMAWQKAIARRLASSLKKRWLPAPTTRECVTSWQI